MLGALLHATPLTRDWYRALKLVSDDELMLASMDELKKIFISAYNIDAPKSFGKWEIINALRGLSHSFWEG